MNSRRQITEADLKRLYVNDGRTIEQIAGRFQCSPATIRRRMRDLGIQPRPRGPFVKHHRQLTWSPEVAYAVGIIATDGNLSPDGRHLAITSADQDLLETVRQCLGLKVAITLVAGTFTNATYYRIQWSHRKFYDWLLSIGLMPNKSLKLGRLAIPDAYMPDFLRGCIGGDGSIITYTDKYNSFKSINYIYKRLFVALVSGSRPFLDWLHQWLGEKLAVRGGVFRRTKGKSTYWMLKYMKKDSIRLISWMYYSPQLPCLARKRDTALRFLGERK